MVLVFLKTKSNMTSSLWVLLILAMELMMGEEPIAASERGECSSNGYELEWTKMDVLGKLAHLMSMVTPSLPWTCSEVAIWRK
jgi:hypothetical protein